MAKRKRKRQKKLGLNPDPERYILVTTKEGSHWRLKRGLNKPALLNDGYRKSAESTKVCSPAARRMKLALQDHLRGLQTGRLTVNFAGALRKAYHRNGKLDFSFLEGYDFQEEHPLEELLKAAYLCKLKTGRIEVQLPIDKYSVSKHNQIVSEYFFDLILLRGDAAMEQGLRIEQITSALYSFKSTKKDVCKLQLSLPETGEPWLVMLKVSCLEGNELAHHPRHYGMKVLRYGGSTTK